jgi:hypothetical protein
LLPPRVHGSQLTSGLPAAEGSRKCLFETAESGGDPEITNRTRMVRPPSSSGLGELAPRPFLLHPPIAGWPKSRWGGVRESEAPLARLRAVEACRLRPRYAPPGRRRRARQVGASIQTFHDRRSFVLHPGRGSGERMLGAEVRFQVPISKSKARGGARPGAVSGSTLFPEQARTGERTRTRPHGRAIFERERPTPASRGARLTEPATAAATGASGRGGPTGVPLKRPVAKARRPLEGRAPASARTGRFRIPSQTRKGPSVGIGEAGKVIGRRASPRIPASRAPAAR